MAGTDGAFRLSCLRARLFGVLRLERDGGQVHLPAKVGSLLAYLILHPGPQPREKMTALLWGDVPDEQARHSLRTALNHIRKEHWGHAGCAYSRRGRSRMRLAMWRVGGLIVLMLGASGADAAGQDRTPAESPSHGWTCSLTDGSYCRSRAGSALV